MLIANSICEKCQTRGTLEAKAEQMLAYPDAVETFIVCASCGTRTHAACSNAQCDELAARARKESDSHLRAEALLRYHVRFEQFQVEMEHKIANGAHQ